MEVKGGLDKGEGGGGGWSFRTGSHMVPDSGI